MNDDFKTRWPVVLTAVLAGAVAAMQVGKAPPVLDLLIMDFDLTLSMAGWVLSTVSVTGACIGLLAGGISDMFGHRRTVVMALCFIILGSLMGSATHDITWLLISRVLESVGFVGVVVSIPSILMRVINLKDQRLVFGIWASYMPFGMAGMMAATPALLTLTDWRGIWQFNALVIGLLLLLFVYMTRDLPNRANQNKPAGFVTSIRQVLALPGPWLLAGCFMAYAGQWAAMMSWLPTYLGDVAHNDMATAAWLTALVVFVNVPGNLFGGWLLQRGMTRWHLIAFGSICMACFGYSVFLADISTTLRVSFAVAFSFFGGFLPTTLLSGVILHSPAPELTATTNGILINGANTGVLLGPPALGALVAAMGGWQATGMAMMVSGGVALAFGLLLGLVEQRRQSLS